MSSSHLAKFDLVVLGGGPAGSSGAVAGGLLGKKVALVEKASLVGGAGINTGTIPSKTLRETSLMLSGWRSRKLFGVDLSLRRETTVADFMRHEKKVTSSERQRVEARLTLRGVRVSKAVPSDVSSASISRVTDDVATPRRCAALAKPPASATSSSVFNASNLSMRAIMPTKTIALHATDVCTQRLFKQCVTTANLCWWQPRCVFGASSVAFAWRTLWGLLVVSLASAVC